MTLRKEILSSITIIMLSSMNADSFKTDQLKYPRVREAYKDKEEGMLLLLKENEIKKDELQLYLRAFKSEKELELWAKNKSDNTFKLIKTYKVCRTSGDPGPKRKQGDRQIPEGFYHINRFNPYSNYYLSLGINYPNRSDKILGVQNALGGDIFIHGACVTIGCLPITNDKIKELYILCVEAKNNGQQIIPVTIFPARLTNEKYTSLSNKYNNEEDKINLWTDLKNAYDIFNEHKTLPTIGFLNNGRHIVKQ